MSHPSSPKNAKTSSDRTTIWLAVAIFVGVFLAAVGLQPPSATHSIAQVFAQPILPTPTSAPLKNVESRPSPIKIAKVTPKVMPPKNCTEARSRGIAPMYVGEPEYGEWMDGDGDGIACEPYHGR